MRASISAQRETPRDSNLTKQSVILKPLNQAIIVSELRKTRRSVDFEALKL